MAGGESSPLSGEQRRALLVLGYLFLRMGQFARAKKLFAALLALEHGGGALEHIDRIVGAAPLSSRDAALHLLKARALWLTGRTDEAKNAVNAWIAAGGGRQ